MQIAEQFNNLVTAAATKVSAMQSATIVSAGAAAGAVTGAVTGDVLSASLLAAGADIQSIMDAVTETAAHAGAKVGFSTGEAAHVWSFDDNVIPERGAPWPGSNAKEKTTQAGDPLNVPSANTKFANKPEAMTSQPVTMKTV